MVIGELMRDTISESAKRVATLVGVLTEMTCGFMIASQVVAMSQATNLAFLCLKFRQLSAIRAVHAAHQSLLE